MSRWICTLGYECHCVREHGEVDQFCVNSRRARKGEEDSDEEASQEEKAVLPALQTSQDAW